MAFPQWAGSNGRDHVAVDRHRYFVQVLCGTTVQTVSEYFPLPAPSGVPCKSCVRCLKRLLREAGA